MIINCRIYEVASKLCKHCHHECLENCFGAGAGNCTKCKHVRDGPYCVPSCPTSKFNDSGECLPCHDNCVGGCNGPENNIGKNGCRSCEKAVINGDVEVVTPFIPLPGSTQCSARLRTRSNSTKFKLNHLQILTVDVVIEDGAVG